MEVPSIAKLLEGRNAWLKGDSGNRELARTRASLTRAVSDEYLAFESLRDDLLALSDASNELVRRSLPAFSDVQLRLVDAMAQQRLLVSRLQGGFECTAEGRRYLSGGWLEELAWLAALEAGADEATFGQVLGWKVKEFSGENEIDVIARKGSELSFISCKALRSELDIHDRKHRNRLMDAVHEADNLTDHFGRDGEKVAVLVTTDLFDELRGVARYNALMGKAAVLDVRIISLEELQWDKLVLAIQGLWQPRDSKGNAA